MLSLSERRRIIDLINREVVPAIGCTEPIAVALCTARAAETLGAGPERIAVRLSANILKNAMGVGIPGTGMIGLPIAVALGALIGRSEYRLEVLRDVTPEAVERGREMIGRRCISIGLKEGVCEKLYIEAEVEAAGHRAVAVIAGGHTDFVFVSRDGEVLFDTRDFAMTSPVEELRFILETRRLNMAAAERSLAGEYGHCVGRTLRCDRERKVMGDSLFTRILSYTSAACDARMAGAMIPVMSNSGSGNQGMTVSLPVLEYARELCISEEKLYRALIVSNLVSIYQKHFIGSLSAFCGAVTAACGCGAAITYLCGGSYEQICMTIVNTVANVGGMVCDGAKASCAAKIASAVDAAITGHHMSMRGRFFQPGEGFVQKDIEETIKSLGYIGRVGMKETDAQILKIMLGQVDL